METPGSAIDKLITVDLKIFQLEDVKRKEGTSDRELADATRLTNKLNSYRNQLIAELDTFFGYDNPITTKVHAK